MIQQWLQFSAEHSPLVQAYTATAGTVLRYLFGIEHRWLAFVPMIGGVAWWVSSFLRRGRQTEWSEQLPMLAMVSLLSTPFAWSHDALLLLPLVMCNGGARKHIGYFGKLARAERRGHWLIPLVALSAGVVLVVSLVRPFDFSDSPASSSLFVALLTLQLLEGLESFAEPRRAVVTAKTTRTPGLPSLQLHTDSHGTGAELGYSLLCVPEVRA